MSSFLDLYGDVPEEDDRDDGGFDDDGYGDNVEDEQKYEATFDQQQHSEKENTCKQINADSREDYIKIYRSLNNTEKLEVDIGSVVNSLNKESNTLLYDITDTQRNYICTMVRNIDAQYTNPLAYVLGYMVMENGCMISSSDDDKTKEKKIQNMRLLFLGKKKDKSGDDNKNFASLANINSIVKSVSDSDYGVYPADVIRYAIMWNKLNV
jgi:hypothetical protein